MKPHVLFVDREFLYDGSQLRSLFAYREFGLLGDSVVAWIGPCQVTPEYMKDGEDLRMGAEIRGDRMLHFIVEKFDTEFFGAVALQRLMSAMAMETLKIMSPEASDMRREGDDLYVGDLKLSISVAASSPVSHVIHFAVNVVNDGTPVKTLSLGDLKVDPRTFALKFLDLVSEEIAGMTAATRKVLPTL